MKKDTSNDKIIHDLLGKLCQIFANTEEEDEFDAKCEVLFVGISDDIRKEVFEMFATMFNSTSTSNWGEKGGA